MGQTVSGPIDDCFLSTVGLCLGIMSPKKKTIRKRAGSRPDKLCKIHGRPIRASYWRAGHRNTGCTECYRTQEVPPPNRRRCQRHGLPILRSRWWSGYRTKGCLLCFKVPPPEKRLCTRHGRPISPSSWRNGRHSTGCSMCHNSRPGYRAAKARYNKRLRLEAARKKRLAARAKAKRAARRR